jgi:hypothetical protein
MRRKHRTRRFIQKTGISKHKGALHRALGVPEGQIIPLAMLEKAAKAPGRLGKQARLALVLRGLPRHHGPRKRHRAHARRRHGFRKGAKLAWNVSYRGHPLLTVFSKNTGERLTAQAAAVKARLIREGYDKGIHLRRAR